MFIFMVFIVQMIQILCLVLRTSSARSASQTHALASADARLGGVRRGRSVGPVVRFLGQLRRSTEEETIVRVSRLAEDPDMHVVVLVDADDRGAACSGGPCWCRSWRQRDVVLEQAVEIHGQQHRWHRRSRRTRRRAASARARRWRARLPQLRHERRESRARAARTARTSSWRLWFVVHAPATNADFKKSVSVPKQPSKNLY